MKHSVHINRPLFREEELDESFVRSGGHGGQNVNKVSTCVILIHKPTGLLIRCDTERSQAKNRELARRRLADRLYHIEKEKEEHARYAEELVRRQKRRPSQAARRRNVESKRRKAEIKRRRRPVGFDE